MKAKINKSDITVKPVKKYNAPKYPTRADAQCAPLLLRKLPSRWEKNAAVIAAVGMLGTMALTSCGTGTGGDKGALMGNVAFDIPTERENTCDAGETTEEWFVTDGIPAPAVLTTEQNITEEFWDTGELMGDVAFDIPTEQDFVEAEEATTENEATNFLNVAPVFVYGEGTGELGGVPPMYPYAILSEEEALAIIKSMMEPMGLNFSAKPPEYIATKNETGNQFEWGDEYVNEVLGDGNIGLNLYNDEKRVGITYINMWAAVQKPEMSDVCDYRPRELAEMTVEDFSQQKGDIAVGVFYDPCINWENDKQQLEQDLREQVRDFIEWLQGQGII